MRQIDPKQMNQHDRTRVEFAKNVENKGEEATLQELADALLGLQSTDTEGLLELHDELLKRYTVLRLKK